MKASASGHRRRRRLSSTRYRRGLAGTAIAAVVMAALTASQAPGVGLGGHDGKGADAAGDASPGDGSYDMELPPLESPNPPGGSAPGGVGDKSGIPKSVLAAYKKAAKSLATSTPGCGLRWELLAGIGKVESGHARGGAVDKEGTTLRPILGPVLNGAGFANIKDTDGGRWDGDTTYDRAVGPMQFIPSTWARWGADGNGDGRKDPNNVHDAALAAGKYLCADGRDLSAKADLDRAILSYNNSSEYLRTVLAWFEFYRKGTHAVPDSDIPPVSVPGLGEPGGGPVKGTPERGGKDGGKDDSATKPGKGSGGSRGNGDKEDGKDGGKGGGHDKPSPEPTAPHALERATDQNITAVAGETFAARPGVRAETAKGKSVKGVKVRFEIRGSTQATFEGGAKEATVTTGADGVATAPALAAGAKTGTFTIRATAVGKNLGTVDFKATVTAPQADKVTRTETTALVADKNGTFADIAVKATRKGKPLAGTTLTATLADTAKGPFFSVDQQGKQVRAPVTVETGPDGVARLSGLRADDKPGTYTLTLTAEGGAKVEVQLTIKG